ncbi:HEPN domain-containing protein [Phenylobacterium aquaticum]|uniref:HEPN domain-containing protein n=1 Tax=Phenylobacterium aquaticum TaxID=1763816 RepID=UPI001F5CECD7|nr:HEPN domain-containing protein [Phenylobacterium aquaticum]MCI3135338.1 HEPN domain-containing protein [Phenylobacterium aquaticum]
MLKREFSRAARVERGLARPRGCGDIRTMRTSLDHLPAGKRRELQLVVEILREEFAKAIAGRKADGVRDGQILKIILFGSYARGDWVEDPVGRYFSDYDLLVVVSDEKLTDVLEFWESAEARLLSELSAGQRLRTPVNFIVHSLADVNDQLSRGRYFFMDIVRDGIALFEVPGADFVDPRPLAPETALEEAQGYFDDYFDSACDFIDQANFAGERGKLKLAAFELHQAVERLYVCVLLVLTLYTPKSHNIIRLRNLAEPLNSQFRAVWPAETKFERRCFELLRAAYVKARYSRHYKVTEEELAWMVERIDVLKAAVEAACQERLKTLAAQAAG